MNSNRKACYIHVPFCKDICSYCDFTRCRYHAGLADKWLSAVKVEIAEKLENVQLATLYIGGGTPSALSSEQLYSLLEVLLPCSQQIEEYTLEANIDSLDSTKLKICTAHGVNRISLGVQTLQDPLLLAIHRHHQKEDVQKAIALIHQNGIHNISIDLMYGLPGQTLSMWQDDLQEVLRSFDIQHISLYALTIEKNSEFGRNGIQNMDPQLEADMFEYAIAYLGAQGFEHYEISNFAKPGYASKHNVMYWCYEDFFGIGCGASGKELHRRYDNTRNLQTYLEVGAVPEMVDLSQDDEMFEMLMMSLRMKQGLYLPGFKAYFQEEVKDHYAEALQRQLSKGLLIVEGDYLKASYQGMLLLNDVLVDFLP